MIYTCKKYTLLRFKNSFRYTLNFRTPYVSSSPQFGWLLLVNWRFYLPPFFEYMFISSSPTIWNNVINSILCECILISSVLLLSCTGYFEYPEEKEDKKWYKNKILRDNFALPTLNYTSGVQIIPKSAYSKKNAHNLAN